MTNVPQASIENNFSGGLKTEFTGLNFPENACTAASNCVFSIIGDVNRREGFDFETNFQLNTLTTPDSNAITTYKWNNAGGDGSTQIIVQQVGATLYFYLSSAATIANPLSKQILSTTVNISTFQATNIVASFDASQECTYADGQGFLFVFNGQCDPFYCTYNTLTQTITATRITIQIRDFAGIPEPGVAVNFRPTTLTAEHQYNLYNQGWNSGWGTTSTTAGTTVISSGTVTFVLANPAVPVVVGQSITAQISGSGTKMIGTVASYDPVSGTLVMTVTSSSGSVTIGFVWNIYSLSVTTADAGIDLITEWNTQSGSPTAGTFPSNADVWWNYRSTNVSQTTPSGKFDPKNTVGYVTINNAQAPQGNVILNAFIQQRSLTAAGVTDTTTTARPTNGCWFQGRVWYAGANASFQPTGDAPFYTWTENIYFSQIFYNNPQQFGYCYQLNDPTSSTLFNELPDDGGVITIQGSGPIYKLFPIQNGLFVFAANGIWFISGSNSGLGFTATDYAISKISGIQSIASTSYVNVLGWPVFWNEEGIYEVKPSGDKQPYGFGGFEVQNMCLGTILSFYQDIPLQSKKYARGDYDPISYTIQWLYRSTNESSVNTRYQFDSALNINTYKGPFYPYSFTVQSSGPYVTGITYVAGPGGSTSPSPTFKYLTAYNNQFTFSEEHDSTNWKDWNSASPVDYTSTFTTGYKLHGSAWKLWQPGYIYMYSNNSVQASYLIRGCWDYANAGNSGKWSTNQKIINNIPNFGNVFRKIRIRGHGLAFQLQVTSVSGYPFNIAGWSMWENINQSI